MPESLRKRHTSNERTAGSFSKETSKMTLSSIPLRQHREKRLGRPPGVKRALPGKDMPGKLRSEYRRSLDPCENSNDSGLGFDHHSDPRHHLAISDRLGWPIHEAKRPRLSIKLEDEDVNDGYCFPESAHLCKMNSEMIRTTPTSSIPPLGTSNNQQIQSGRTLAKCSSTPSRQLLPSPTTLSSQLMATSRFADISLTIIKQPEQQHRARYQTEGSRGAVKDREGNGFPIVQLNGYYKPAMLQIFIGTDVGKVSPHMFYQACKVSGKNSTPCAEKKIDGTCVIELQLDPTKDMSATCDCVGILKERNVDVEHRFPDQLGNRSKKKSTRCRMIFRTCILHEDGRQEVLQVCSQPIVCTQPPGVPEICKKSLTSCPASGGLELFVLGKNFSKDTKVYFQQISEDRLVRWEQGVVPDKEFLQQTHFVCVVPPFRRTEINEPVPVRLFVVANGKTSESHQFIYTPVNGAVPSVHLVAEHSETPFFNKMLWMPSALSKREQDLGMMPPPETNLVPLSSRRSSINHSSSSNEMHSPPLSNLKQEYLDESSQNSVLDPSELHQERYRHISESSLDVHHGDSNISMINENSMDMLHHDSSNSIEMMVRRNSLGQMQDKCLEPSLTSASMMNEDSSCSSVHFANSLMACNDIHSTTKSELEVIDLRMKVPLATVADLAGSSAPSLATIRNFVTETPNFPLPTQTAQSVERFLTNIEAKTTQSNAMSFKNHIAEPLMHSQVMPQSLLPPVDMGKSLNDNVFMMPQPHSFLDTQTTNTSSICSLPKLNNIISSSKTEISNESIPTLNDEKLEALFNHATEQILPQAQEKLPSESSNTILSTSMVTQNLSNQIVQTLTSDHNSNITSDVILNSQVSPTLMCPTSGTISQDSLIPAIENNISQQQQMALLPVSTAHSTISSLPLVPQVSLEPEKVVILEATADLLKTQKELSEFQDKLIMDDIISITDRNVLPNNASQETDQLSENILLNEPKSDLIIPVSVKEMQLESTDLTDEKTEEKMFVSETELIGYMNPACFD